MKIFTAATLLSLASAVMAFETSVPCLMWSPRNYINTVKTTDQFVISKADATSTIMSSLSDNICSAKLIALVNQPEIHSDDFKRYEYAFNELKEQNKKADSRSQIEYIANGVDVEGVAKMIASQCDTAVSILDASSITSEDLVQGKSPIVAVVSLPAANDNVNTLKENDALLEQLIQVVEEKVQDDYAVIYTSSDAKSSEGQKLYRRAPETAAPVKSVPIFVKYQLFTPGVFMVLGVVILFMFIAGVGITWLTGIQTPVRMESKQKKN